MIGTMATGIDRHRHRVAAVGGENVDQVEHPEGVECPEDDGHHHGRPDQRQHDAEDGAQSADPAGATASSISAGSACRPTIRPQTMTPPLTTTSSSTRAPGERITTIALATADGADPASVQEVWPVEIVFRGSVGPAQAARD
jgi:hypothetical protein